MGIGTAATMRDQKQRTTQFSTTDATNPTFKITRQIQDFPAPRRPTTSSSGNLNARSPGTSRSPNTSRPPGQRLELSPAMKARIQANAQRRGSAAAGAGKLLRSGKPIGPKGRGEPDKRLQRRKRPERAAELQDPDYDDPAETDAKVYEHVAPPPREWIDHVPEHLSLEDLSVDWPSIPTGQVGMVEGVTSKLRWMAGRMQHGYDTPVQLADRLRRGEMVHFESPEEKEAVLKITTSKEPTPFWNVGERDRRVLAQQLVRGDYEDEVKGGRHLMKQEKRHRFLDEVIRMLGNNETYHTREKSQLVGTIQRFLGGQRQVQRQQQERQAQKE